MKNIVNTYVNRFLHEKSIRRRVVGVIVVLAVVVAGGVYWQLHSSGVAKVNEVYCGMEEHTHSEDCYTDGVLTCDIPEHVHTAACLSDVTADVESASDWEATLPGDLSGIWADDVVAVAESQVGYTESDRNFTVAEETDLDGEAVHNGYTRYGAWYGNAYGDWDAMFAAFCLHYAGISEDAFPVNSGAEAWIVDLKKAQEVSGAVLYADAADVVPQAGDLAFLDTDADGVADRVAIITAVTTGTINVIEGDCEGAVAEHTYRVDTDASATVIGYALLPQQGPEVAEQTLDAQIYADDSYKAGADDTADITLSGVMPEGAVVKSYPVDVELEGVNVLAAYDITIYDADGNEYQPQDGAITVTIDTDKIQAALADDTALAVYHMEDADAQPQEVATIAADADEVAFEAESFSVYIVTDGIYRDAATGDTATVYTVKFEEYVFDDGTVTPITIPEQKVTADEKLEEPTTPEVANHIFVGWYTEQQGTDGTVGTNSYDFSKTLQENLDSWDGYTVENNTITLYSDYRKAYYVYYMTRELTEEELTDCPEGFTTGYEPFDFHTEAYDDVNSTLITSSATNIYNTEYLGNSGYAVTGWYYKSGESKVYISDTDQVTGDLTLYPEVSEAYWFYFDMNIDADSDEVYQEVDPVYILSNATTVGEGTLQTPERSGYEFKGWYTDADTTDENEVTASTAVSTLFTAEKTSVTLYAKWEATTIGYTINIWRQKATDGQEGLDQKVYTEGEAYSTYIGYYDFAESISVSDDQSELKTGDVLDSDSTSKIYNWSTYTDYGTVEYGSTSAYNGFEYSEDSKNRTENGLTGTTMKADGSTVINIYYNRVTVTWTFYHTRLIGSDTLFGTLIGLYGTNIEPTNGSTSSGTLTGWEDYGNNYSWTYTTAGGSTVYPGFETCFILLDTTDPANVRFEDAVNGSRSATVYYYKEVTNESEQIGTTVTVNEKTYVYDRSVTYSWTIITSSGHDLNLEDKYVGYTLSGYSKTTGSMSEIPSDYNVSVSNGDSVYIYYDAIEYTIELLSNSKEGTRTVQTYMVKYGADLSNIAFPTSLDADTFGPASYYQFTGDWYSDPTLSVSFTMPSTMPAYNLAAYAKWELKPITVRLSSTVASDLEDVLSEAYPGEDVTADEDGFYSVTITAGDTLASALGELTATEGENRYIHVGWLNGDQLFNLGTHLYEDTTLKACWNDTERETFTIKYHLNTGSDLSWSDGVGHSEDSAGEYLKTIEDILEALSATLDEEHDGKFICWNTSSDGTGTAYYPDTVYDFKDAVADDTDFDHVIDLYAVWAQEKEATLVLNYNYPSGTPATGETEYDSQTITQENLNTIDLTDASLVTHYLKEGEEITIDGYTYIFLGWSQTQVTDYATSTKADANIPADATVAVNSLVNGVEVENAVNTIYAVWSLEPVITILKTDVDMTAEEPTLLDGAQFTLTRVITVDGEEVTQYYTSEGTWETLDGEAAAFTLTDGQLAITVKEDGTYTLTEVQSPDGYTPYEGSIIFTVEDYEVTLTTPGADANDNMVGLATTGSRRYTLTVRNEPGTELPKTGSVGTRPYTAGGLLLVAIAAAAFVYTSRKSKRKEGAIH